MSITITVPNDDHVALRAMAKALEEIAVARGAPAQSTQVRELNYKFNIDTTQATSALKELVKQAEVDTTSQQCESLLKGYEELPPVHDDEQAPPDTDSTGTQWDERIHSASKALNSDGTWRLRRKPKDMDEAEWVEYVEMIKADLLYSVECGDEEEIDPRFKCDKDFPAFEIPTERKEVYPNVFNNDEPSVTPEGDDFHTDTGVVTEQQLASFPPPPPVPVPAAPVAECTPPKGNEYAHMTFPDVMKFLTERHARISNEQVTEIIREMGLTSIMDLNTQPEHTGPFIARVKAHLGE